METYTAHVVVGEDKKIRLEIPCNLSPGPVDVVVVLAPATVNPIRLRDLPPLPKDEFWDNMDPQEWVNILRSGQDLTPYLEKMRAQAPTEEIRPS